VVQGKGIRVNSLQIARGGPDPKAAAVGVQSAFMDGKDVKATVYDRALLKAGNRVKGPAIVMEMDSTTVVLPKHTGLVDRLGNILIYPDGHKRLGGGKAAGKSARKPARAAKGAPARRGAARKAAKSRGRK
jgi:hypothetical protein